MCFKNKVGHSKLKKIQIQKCELKKYQLVIKRHTASKKQTLLVNGTKRGSNPLAL